MRFFGGYLTVRLRGFSPERFLNLCMARQILLWNLRYGENGYEFYISLKDFKRVKPIVRKSGVHLQVTGKYGLPFFLHRNRRRKLYAAGVLSFFLILFLLSRFIWNISFEGNHTFTDDRLIHYLKTQDIAYGMRKSKINCDLLEESIRANYPDIIWVSARVSGTRLLIKIKENDAVGILPEKDLTPRNLVADQSGIITSMIVREGKSQVKIGDVVEKGQVLVSGVIPIYNDAEELVNQHFVRADADILIQTECMERERVAKRCQERFYTGEERKGVRIYVGKNNFVCMLPGKKNSRWEFLTQSMQLCILRDFYLPVRIDKIQGAAYEIYERSRTKEEIAIMKDEMNKKTMEKFVEKGVEIIENNVRILDKGTYWEIEGQYTVIQPAGAGQNIEQEEELIIPDERN